MGQILNEDNIFWLVKFSNCKQYLHDLQNGKLYMNNGKYFIEREKKDGAKGIGDKYELSQVINNTNIELYTSKTNELLFEGQIPSISFCCNRFLTKPMFCLTHISADCQMDFRLEQIKQIEKEFGEYALFINAKAFMEKIDLAFEKLGIEYIADKIKYEDFSVNSIERMNLYLNNNPSLFFFKDIPFKHQKEYRIIITNKDSEEAFIPHIGSISDISYLLPTRDLLSNKSKLNLYRK